MSAGNEPIGKGQSDGKREAREWRQLTADYDRACAVTSGCLTADYDRACAFTSGCGSRAREYVDEKHGKLVTYAERHPEYKDKVPPHPESLSGSDRARLAAIATAIVMGLYKQ